jgi:hypothetical protein
MTKNDITTMLTNSICNIVFTKLDGTERKLRCTLRSDLLPIKEKETKQRKQSPDVQPVFDLDSNAWKAFRFDSVLSVVQE